MNNKTIWITGASSGIGKSLALKFAKEGWKVAISARRENLLNEISKSNDSINAFPLDVTDKEKCKSVFSEVKEKLGEIDISVFCTGIHDPKSEKTLKRFRRYCKPQEGWKRPKIVISTEIETLVESLFLKE